MLQLPDSWREPLADATATPAFAQLCRSVEDAYARTTVYPPREKLFAALERTPFDSVKVVILGQDPYHEPGQAQGLAFYVPPEAPTPPSLRNIAKELTDEYPDLNFAPRPDLPHWASQGVLLVNAILTVEAGKAGSHRNLGWEDFTDAILKTLSARRPHLVFLLWGAYAQKKAVLVDRTRHAVLACAHPSPLSARRGFFGCGHFRATNAFLVKHGLPEIRWDNPRSHH